MTYDSQGRRVLQGQPSTWEAEAKALRQQNAELALQVLAAEGQAEEAYQAQLSAESAASWSDIMANQAVNEVKALRAQVQELEKVLSEVQRLREIVDGARKIIEEHDRNQLTKEST